MEETIYSLYVHIFPNNKVYVGITGTAPKVRWGNNGVGYKEQSLIWNAIQKYGWNNIQHIVILQTKFKDEIEKQERYFITEVYHSNEKDKGYNILSGGYNGKGKHIFSEEIKKEMSIRFSGENNPNYGKHWWTNDIDQCMSIECPGIGWHLGQLPLSENDIRKINKPIKNAILYNNGKSQHYFKESDTIPSGWILGALPLSEEKIKIKTERRNKTLKEKYDIDNINDSPWMKEAHAKLKGENSPIYGKKWYNNGKENLLLKKDDPVPEGFKEGMAPNANIGKKWWNDGEKEVFRFEKPDNTYTEGRLKRKYRLS